MCEMIIAKRCWWYLYVGHTGQRHKGTKPTLPVVIYLRVTHNVFYVLRGLWQFFSSRQTCTEKVWRVSNE